MKPLAKLYEKGRPTTVYAIEEHAPQAYEKVVGRQGELLDAAKLPEEAAQQLRLPRKS